MLAAVPKHQTFPCWSHPCAKEDLFSAHTRSFINCCYSSRGTCCVPADNKAAALSLLSTKQLAVSLLSTQQLAVFLPSTAACCVPTKHSTLLCFYRAQQLAVFLPSTAAYCAPTEHSSLQCSYRAQQLAMFVPSTAAVRAMFLSNLYAPPPSRL